MGDGSDPLAVGLQHLRLSYNTVGNHGAIALARAISVNKTLKTLTLKNGGVSDEGLVAIGKALSSNNTLQHLALFGNDFNNNDTGALYVPASASLSASLGTFLSPSNSHTH